MKKKYTYLGIGNKLKELRKYLSQKEFAEKIGVSFRAYCYYESGERLPPEPVLRRIVEECNTTVDEIFGRGIAGEKETYTRKEHELMDMLVAVLRGENEDNSKAIIENVKAFYKTRNINIPDESKKKTPENTEESGGHGMVGDHPRLDQGPKLGGNSYLEDVG